MRELPTVMRHSRIAAAGLLLISVLAMGCGATSSPSPTAGTPAASPSPTPAPPIARPGCGTALLTSATSTPTLRGSPLAILGLAGASPTALVTDPSGDVWFSDTGGGRVGRFVAGRLTLWQLGLGGAPGFLTSDGHDGVSIPDEGNGAIFHVTTDGTITECLLPSASSQAYGVAVTSDGSVWVVEMAANAVVRVSASGQMTSYAVPQREQRRWTSPWGLTATSGSRCRPATWWAGSLPPGWCPYSLSPGRRRRRARSPPGLTTLFGSPSSAVARWSGSRSAVRCGRSQPR